MVRVCFSLTIDINLLFQQAAGRSGIEGDEHFSLLSLRLGQTGKGKS